MRLRHIKGAEELIASNRFVIQDMEGMRGKHEHPLHIEVGTGKGRFITTLAELHPEIHYIGIENHSSVLLRAVQKLEESELPNLRFMLLDAAGIEDVFAPCEVDKIYLNFPIRGRRTDTPKGDFLQDSSLTDFIRSLPMMG